jgi:NADH:ubiquinone oxidoreductase subunit E
MNKTPKTTRTEQELNVARIRFVVSLLAYIVCAATKSTARVVFFAPRREKPNASYLHPPSLPVVCKGFSTPLRARRGAVIFDDLRAIQLRHGFLPKAELEGLSQRTQTPLYQIHSIASFYPHFHLAPPPKAEIRVCADMSCHLNGACALRANLERCFANSRPDDVQIRDVSCLGRCDHAPAISINDHIFTHVTAARAEEAPAFRVSTPGQWVEERTSDAEELLWRKTCVQCHSLSMRITDNDKLPLVMPRLRNADDNRPVLRPLPEIVLARAVGQWMPHAKFDHDSHHGFSCVSCHAKALTSTESSDVLLPGIETCKKCHAPGPEHAESRCFECHTYHDWAKRKEVTPKFTLPALRTGGQ